MSMSPKSSALQIEAFHISSLILSARIAYLQDISWFVSWLYILIYISWNKFMLLCIVSSPGLCASKHCAMMRIHRVHYNNQKSRSDLDSGL